MDNLDPAQVQAYMEGMASMMSQEEKLAFAVMMHNQLLHAIGQRLDVIEAYLGIAYEMRDDGTVVATAPKPDGYEGERSSVDHPVETVETTGGYL
jgi:hypothetical protein